MSNDRKAIPALSALNVLLCLLVIFIHVSASPVTTLDKSSAAYAVVFIPWRLSAFVVQGFIFLSGVKHFLSTEVIDYRKFYLSRFRKILVPYVLWNIVYYAYFIANGYFSFSLTELIKYIALGTLVGPFYFVVVIVQFYALMPLWKKLVDRVSPAIVLPLSAVLTLVLSQYLPRLLSNISPGLTFTYNDRIFTTYLFYWVLGCYAGKYHDSFTRYIKRNKVLIILVFAVFTVLEAGLSYLTFTGLRPIAWLEHIHYLYCISAVLFSYGLVTWIYDQRPAVNAVIRRIDRSSYGIYLAHALAIFEIDQIMYRLGIHRIDLSYVLRIVVVYGVTIVLCTVWTHTTSKLLRNKVLQKSAAG